MSGDIFYKPTVRCHFKSSCVYKKLKSHFDAFFLFCSELQMKLHWATYKHSIKWNLSYIRMNSKWTIQWFSVCTQHTQNNYHKLKIFNRFADQLLCQSICESYYEYKWMRINKVLGLQACKIKYLSLYIYIYALYYKI